MKVDFRDTLLTAFERGIFASPCQDESWVIFNADTFPENASLIGDLELSKFKQLAMSEQGFRPIYNSLNKQGYQVSEAVPSTRLFDHSIIFVSRSRGRNEANFLRGWEQTKPGGRIIICGAKKAGADGIRNWLSTPLGNISSFSKNHALCFEVPRAHTPCPVVATKTGEAAYGIFSADKIDPGSDLLAQHFGTNVRGKVADFGAGWGYLSKQIIDKCPRAEAIDLYEAEYTALEVARDNLSGDSTKPLSFHWIDLLTEFKKKPYDTVVMNPPFHHGLTGSRQSDPALGQAFIRIASSTLVQGGRLLMVANLKLPYEKTLGQCFRRYEKIADNGQFKVFEAVR